MIRKGPLLPELGGGCRWVEDNVIKQILAPVTDTEPRARPQNDVNIKWILQTLVGLGVNH